MRAIENEDVADVFERVADLLEAQRASVFRVDAYRRAADTIRGLDRSLVGLFSEGGRSKVLELPGIGRSLASALDEVVHTGRLGLLERLEGQVSPEALFMTVPGIGDALAQRIHQELDIETLEDLELAAHDGRLEEVPGFGRRRTRAVREVLASMLRRSGRRRARRFSTKAPGDAGAPGPGQGEVSRELPPVAILLSVDDEYLRKSRGGELPTIAPRRFNPRKEAWLPILHTERDGWSFTALFSNTARAHELGRTGDWVVVYFERDGQEGQATVVTEYRGELDGRRVVRGRETECWLHYSAAS
jgi:DNA polymerase (family X)